MPKKPIKCNSLFWDLLWFPRENGSQEGEQRTVKLILLLCLAVLCQQLSFLTAKRSFENTGCPGPLGQLVTSFLSDPFCTPVWSQPLGDVSLGPRGLDGRIARQESRIVTLGCLLCFPLQISYFRWVFFSFSISTPSLCLICPVCIQFCSNRSATYLSSDVDTSWSGKHEALLSLFL